MIDCEVKVSSGRLPLTLSGLTCSKLKTHMQAHEHTKARIHTLVYVLDGPAYAPVKGAGVSRALEGQSKLLVIDPPVVEYGVDLVVYEVFLQNTL